MAGSSAAGEDMMELCSGAHIKYQVVYHLQWAPKYRYKIFKKESHKKDYKMVLEEAAERHEIKIMELAIMPDHVHAVVRCPASMSVSKALFYLKGASSHDFFQLHPNMRKCYRRGHLLSAGKFCRTVGDVDLETTKEYVREQAVQTTLTSF